MCAIAFSTLTPLKLKLLCIAPKDHLVILTCLNQSFRTRTVHCLILTIRLDCFIGNRLRFVQHIHPLSATSIAACCSDWPPLCHAVDRPDCLCPSGRASRHQPSVALWRRRPLLHHNIGYSVTVCCVQGTLITRRENNVDGKSCSTSPQITQPPRGAD